MSDGICKALRALVSPQHCLERPHASGANDAEPCGSDELQIAEALEAMACEAWFWMGFGCFGRIFPLVN